MLHISARKRFYAFFSSLFAYPDADLLKLLTPGNLEELVILLPGSSPHPDLAAKNLLEELQVGFTGLFINRLGGAPAPPYGSVYLEDAGRLAGPTTQAVAAAYRAEGLAVEGSPEPPDYLATELEFLYFLIQQEEAALTARDIPAARVAIGKQSQFFACYLHPWVGEFCRRVIADEQSPELYRWGASLLQRFVEFEQRWLEKHSPA